MWVMPKQNFLADDLSDVSQFISDVTSSADSSQKITVSPSITYIALKTVENNGKLFNTSVASVYLSVKLHQGSFKT